NLLAVHRLGLAGKETRARHAVTADVHEPAALELVVQAHVTRVVAREAERRGAETEPPDRPALDELLEAPRLRVVPVHECLHENPAGLLGGVEGPLDVLWMAAERLLAEDVLARLERLDRPLDVHGVRQRDVHGLDFWIREEILVAPVGALDPAVPCVGLRSAEIAARDRDELHVRRSRGP